MDQMKVFISWSGQQSRAAAAGLRDWLPNIFANTIEFWISRDIRPGKRGLLEIAQQLEGTSMSIVCLTQSNLEAPWIQFEAGNISKAVEQSYLWTYLIGVSIPDLGDGNPLSQFQASKADEDGTYKIVEVMNELAHHSHRPDKLRGVFDRWWPDLEGILGNLPSDEEACVPKRPPEVILEELVAEVRGQRADSMSRAKIIADHLLEIQNDISGRNRAALFRRIAESQGGSEIREPLSDAARVILPGERRNSGGATSAAEFVTQPPPEPPK